MEGTTISMDVFTLYSTMAHFLSCSLFHSHRIFFRLASSHFWSFPSELSYIFIYIGASFTDSFVYFRSMSTMLSTNHRQNFYSVPIVIVPNITMSFVRWCRRCEAIQSNLIFHITISMPGAGQAPWWGGFGNHGYLRTLSVDCFVSCGGRAVLMTVFLQ